MARRKIIGRAETDDEKEDILARLGVLWEANPSLRLGQLIGNVFLLPGKPHSLVNVEDYEMIGLLEEKYGRR